MKGYPLIYSRTKNKDFVPDFLARPKDLDCREALKYVGNAMENLDFIQGIRYTAFPVGNYCVCGGIACISARLVERLKVLSIGFTSRYSDAAEYLRDNKGRNIACFIGIAIPKSEAKQDMIPNIPLEQYWEIYLEYLKHQWLSETSTHSEQLDMPPIDIVEKRYSGAFKPEIEKYGTHSVIKAYSMHAQQILDYFFHSIMSGGDESIITEIYNRKDLENLNFKTAAVSDALYQTLKSSPDAKESLRKGGNAKQGGDVIIQRGQKEEESDKGQKKRMFRVA